MRYMLILLGLLVTGTASAMDCEKVPDCESLGYSKAEDPNCADDGYMYCPFNREYKKCVNMDCAKLGFTESDKSSWCSKLIKCKGNEKMTLCQNLCEIGDVFYDNGTCGYVDDYDPNDKNKIPVGVVFHVTDEGRHGTVINLKDLSIDNETYVFNPDSPYDSDLKKIPYGLHNTDVPEIMNRPNEEQLVKELENRSSDLYDGKRLTTVLAQTKATYSQCVNGSFLEGTKNYAIYCQATAAKAALAFYPPLTSPENPLTGQGHWYLPAAGNWYDFCQPRHTVNATLKKLKEKGAQAAQLTWANSWSVSVTEHVAYAEWTMALDICAFGSHLKKNPMYVRVFLDF